MRAARHARMHTHTHTHTRLTRDGSKGRRSANSAHPSVCQNGGLGHQSVCLEWNASVCLEWNVTALGGTCTTLHVHRGSTTISSIGSNIVAQLGVVGEEACTDAHQRQVYVPPTPHCDHPSNLKR